MQERLLERRIVLVDGFLDDATAASAAAQLMLLDADGDDPVTVHLTCPDGELGAAEMLAEAIDLLGVPVYAVCRGTLAGGALAPYAAADRRLASPHAVFALREPKTSANGRADEIAALVTAHQRQLARLVDRLAAATGHPPERIAADLRAGLVLVAPEALDYGLVGELARRPGA